MIEVHERKIAECLINCAEYKLKQISIVVVCNFNKPERQIKIQSVEHTVKLTSKRDFLII